MPHTALPTFIKWHKWRRKNNKKREKTDYAVLCVEWDTGAREALFFFFYKLVVWEIFGFPYLYTINGERVGAQTRTVCQRCLTVARYASRNGTHRYSVLARLDFTLWRTTTFSCVPALLTRCRYSFPPSPHHARGTQEAPMLTSWADQTECAAAASRNAALISLCLLFFLYVPRASKSVKKTHR